MKPTFVLFPEGSSWIAVEFDRTNQINRMTEQSNAATHIASNDAWAEVCEAIKDSETDATISAETARAVIEAYNAFTGTDMAPESVVVEELLR